MKATGIVRRIDDLGRVVIPKEIRRTQRIRVSDPLEIFVSGDGEVIFRKYSPVGELQSFAEQYVQVLSKVLGITIVICDRDVVVASAGQGHRDCLAKRVTAQVEKLMDHRQAYEHTGRSSDAFLACEGAGRIVLVAEPIIVAGDVSGAVLALAQEATAKPTTDIKKALQIASLFLACQMEA